MAPVQSTRAPRSLADDLRARSHGQIRQLLALRPDLLNPWPTDISQLARRAADDASVLEAMGSVSTRGLRVLEVFAALHEGTAEQIARALDEEVDDILEDLWNRALLWGGPVLKIVRAAQQAFGPYPCGLGPDCHLTADPQAVAEAALDIDPDRLRYLVWEQPVSSSASPLAVVRGEQHVVPREVSLILREGLFLRPVVAPEVPSDATHQPAPAVWNPIAGVRYALTDLAQQPLPWHPQRGVSRRVLQDRAAAMSVPVEDLAVWLELAGQAGLIGGKDTAAHPTGEAHRWLVSSPAAMWQTLAAAWLDSDRPLGRCRPDELGCLTTSGVPRLAHHRKQVLAVWPPAELTAAQLETVVAWERPRLEEARRQVPDFMAELTALGLLVGGVPVEGLATPAALQVPDADSSLIIQPDHTVIAPANLDAATWSLLHDIAKVESWGPVLMLRLDQTRLPAALTRRTADEVLDHLAQVSRTPVPQSVEYIVRDAGRKTAVHVSRETIIRTGEQDAPAVRALGLHEIAPNTFSTAQPVDSVRRLLAEAAVAVSSLEQPVVADPLDYPRTPSHMAEAVDRLVEHLVADPVQVGPVPALEPVDLQALRSALAEPRLWLEFTDGQQTLTQLVEPLEVSSGRLSAWSLSASRTITVPLSRITALRIVDD